MNSEHRMHVSLSRYAYEVLVADRDSFAPKKQLGSFANDVIERSMQSSLASISIAKQAKVEKYREALRISRYRMERPKDHDLKRYDPDKVSLTAGDEALIEQLAEGYAEKLAKSAASKAKDIPLKLRLRKDTFDYLTPEAPDSWPESGYYKRQSDYIKAIIEEYCEKSHYDREGIIFCEQLNVLSSETELPFEQRRILTIQTTSKNGKVSRYDVKPYAVMPDIKGNYHYLVCLSKDPGNPEDSYKVASLRLSRISASIKVRPKSYGSGKLTKLQQREIKDALEKRGVQFLLGANELFEVKLTDRGMSMFGEVLHLRPTPIEERDLGDGNHILSFDCTQRQVENYFFQFGQDAIVANSPEISALFHERYSTAALAYELANQDCTH